MKPNRSTVRRMQPGRSLPGLSRSAALGALVAQAATSLYAADTTLPAGMPEAVVAESPLQRLPQGGTIVPRQFQFIGNETIADTTLAALVAEAIGQPQDLQQLQALALRITLHYREQGLFVTQAWIPEQTLAEGNVVIRVVEGSIGDVIMENGAQVPQTLVAGMLDQVKQRRIVSIDSLERALLLLDDTPGIDITRADVLPGEHMGTSDFVIGTTAVPGRELQVLFDDFGSHHTGRQRLLLQAQLQAPRRRGDLLTLNAVLSNEGIASTLRAAYSIPLPATGWRAEVAHTHVHDITGTVSAATTTMRAELSDLTFSYPLLRTRAASLQAAVGFSHKHITDTYVDSSTRFDRRARSLHAGLGLRSDDTAFGLDASTTAGLDFTLGSLAPRDDHSRALDRTGAQTRGTYTKVNVYLDRNTWLTPALSLYTGASYQQALNDRNLDVIEQLAISGLTGVLGYPVGELQNSDARLLRLDLGYSLPAGRLSVFSNWGQVAAAVPLPGQGARTLSDAGIAWKLDSSNWTLQAWWAQQLRGPSSSEASSRQSLHLQAGYNF